MANVYDLAHELTAAMKQSDEYKEYIELKNKAMENDTQRALLEEYKRLQFKLQVAMASGENAPPEEMERLQKIAGVLQMSPEATAYMMSEFRYQRMLADIYKILGEAGGIDMDLLTGAK